MNSQIHVAGDRTHRVIVVRTGRRIRVGREVDGQTSKVVQRPSDPLPGGATIWIETDEDVQVRR